MNSPEENSAETAPALLLGDVGGTHARFSLVAAEGHTPSPLATVSLATAEYAEAPALLRAAREQLADALADREIAGCAIAVAGPIANGSGRLTNGVLVFEESQLVEWLGCPVRLVNDFYAVAASINDDTPVQPIGVLSEPLVDVRAVIGPGTGLGMGYLVPPAGEADTHWRVFASEGGNADFAPIDALELELLGIMQRDSQTVSIESLVSGRGLPNLYAALCELWGAPVVHKNAADISTAALADDADPLSHKTLELFCAMLGTAAGNFALTVGARGGVYLAGGILPRMREFFVASDFRRRFDDRGALSAFNQQIPTFLVLDPEPGLSGALALARRLV